MIGAPAVGVKTAKTPEGHRPARTAGLYERQFLALFDRLPAVVIPVGKNVVVQGHGVRRIHSWGQCFCLRRKSKTHVTGRLAETWSHRRGGGKEGVYLWPVLEFVRHTPTPIIAASTCESRSEGGLRTVDWCNAKKSHAGIPASSDRCVQVRHTLLMRGCADSARPGFFVMRRSHV